ncbi:MAG: methyltransferase domain-containing protein [Actinomycetota bacterium]
MSDPGYWDERYSSAGQLWSGAPNLVLVDVVAALPAGRALDVGCGEGADAVWLAQRGWVVTALDVSGVALQRAAAHAHDAGVDIRLVHAGLVEAEIDPGGFDLVSAQYPVLAKSLGSVAEHALLDAVAPGGTLLVVHHAEFQDGHAHDGIDASDYVGPWDLVPMLGVAWRIEVDETRERHMTAGAGAHHKADVVLMARRI